jgi:hypothetical protein
MVTTQAAALQRLRCRQLASGHPAWRPARVCHRGTHFPERLLLLPLLLLPLQGQAGADAGGLLGGP